MPRQPPWRVAQPLLSLPRNERHRSKGKFRGALRNARLAAAVGVGAASAKGRKVDFAGTIGCDNILRTYLENRMYRFLGCGLLMAATACAGPAARLERSAVTMVNPPGVAPPVAAYSHMATVPPGTKLLFLAGQIGNRPDGSLPPKVEDQIIQAYENVRTILASQGAGPQHIAKVMIYASAEPTDWPKLRAHRKTFFGDGMPPPSTWVYVRQLARPNYLVEIEVVAAVPDS